MRSFLLTACLLAMASPAAFAAEGTDTTSNKHIGVTGGFTVGDAGVAPTASLSYLFNDHWSVELWGTADKLQQNLRVKSGPRIGTYSHQPVALSAQYHFGAADSVFRPFLGVGGFVSNISDVQVAAPATPGATNIHGKSAAGYVVTAGVDMNINETWFARADARLLYSDMRIDTAAASDLKLKGNMPVAGFSIGARF